MRCESVRPELGALTAGGLNGWRERRIRRHLDGCPACRAEYVSYQAVDEALTRELRAVDPPEGLWDSIHRAIAAEPDRRSARKSFPGRSGAWAFGLGTVAALAVALAYLETPRRPSPAILPPAVRSPLRADRMDRSDYTERYLMGAWRNPLADQVALGTIASLRPSTKPEARP